jgi:hypothetical protein
MSFRRHATVVLLASLLFALPVHARTESSGSSHVAFDVPDSWATSTQNRQVVVQSPDHQIIVEVDYVNTAAEVQVGMAQLNANLTARFQTIHVDGPPRQVTQRGLNGPVQSGTAVRNGRPVRFFAMVLGHPGGGAIIVGFVAVTSTPADVATLRAVLDSFRRTP